LTGVENQFVVYEGYRFRLEDKGTINIVDGASVINLKSFAFDADSSMLVVGSAEGSIYGFEVKDGKVAKEYSLKKNIAVAGEMTINSISISAKSKVAVGAKDTLVVF